MSEQLTEQSALNNFVSLAIRSESADFAAISKRLSDVKVIRLIHASMGMCTETGEFTDQLKRHIFYGSPLDEGNLLEEIGDKLWYLAIALSAIDKELGEAAFKVIEKLRRRYPDKFNEHQAINRDPDAEKEGLFTS